MNILQILPELNVGGVETGTLDFARYLVQNGHRAVVVSHGGVLLKELQSMGVQHYTLPVHKKSLWTILRCIREFEDILRAEKVDVVHARSRIPAWIAFFACRRTKTAFVTTCHGYYGNHILSRVMGWSKLVIVPSGVIGRHMIEDFGVLPENIRRIPRSVDLSKFDGLAKTKLKNECVVTMIGRITPLKGHKYFLKAMARVIRSIPYLKIWIVGDSLRGKESYRRELELLVKRLGLGDYVEFLGSRQDIPEILGRTNVLVLSTVTEEAFGRVILEAQASGVPVVATKVGGVVEIIEDGRTGLLVLPRDPEAMARSVIRLLKDEKLAASLTSRAREKLQREFTLERMAERTLSVYEELLGLMSILVIKISSLGDVILATPSLKALKEKFPRAKIYCVVGKDSRAVLQRCPYLDDLIVFDPKEKDKGWGGLLKFSRKLRKYKFDLVVDFQNNRTSHWMSFLVFPVDSYGYDNGKWGFLLSQRIKDDQRNLPPVAHQFRILHGLGIPYRPDCRLEFWLNAQDEKRTQALMESEWVAKNQKVIGINLSASKEWITKNWPLKYMAELCDQLAQKGLRVILTGMEKDRDTAHELSMMTKAKPASFVGKTDVLELAVLIRRCAVYVTPDSAPLHIAAAVKTPFVALFGPTDARRHMPPAGRCTVLQKDLKCSPCYSTYCKVATHACMREITPSQVLHEIEKLMTS